jgi:hypothetical protein
VNDYQANGCRSLARLEDAIERRREFFDDYRAVEITGDKVTACITFPAGAESRERDDQQRIICFVDSV